MSDYYIDNIELKVQTSFGLYDIPEEKEEEMVETLWEEQNKLFHELVASKGNVYEVRLHPSHFGNGMTWYRADDPDKVLNDIQLLAIKDGVDLVKYPSGNYGFVAYYNGYKSGFEVIPHKLKTR